MKIFHINMMKPVYLCLFLYLVSENCHMAHIDLSQSQVQESTADFYVFIEIVLLGILDFETAFREIKLIPSITEQLN